MITNVLIIFIHALTPCYWTAQIESGLETELTKSGIEISSRSYHLPEMGNDPEKILQKITKHRPGIVVMTNDLKGDAASLPEQIKKLGIPVFFAGKKIPVKGDKDKGSCGVYGRQNYNGSVESIEGVTRTKVKKVGIVSSPNPLLKLLVQNFREDVKGREIIEEEVVSFKDWVAAVDKLINIDKVDVLLPYLPYGGTYKGAPVTTKHWPFYKEALLRINKSTPTIGGGSIRNSQFPVLLAFAQDPTGLGKQVASKIFLHLRNGSKLYDIGFSKPNYFELQVNMEELRRLDEKLPPHFLNYATLLNNKDNAIEGYRRKLDEIDSEVVKLLKRRQQVSLEIGTHKKNNNLKVLSGKEEDFAIERKIKKCIERGLDPDFSRDYASMAIRHSRIIQYEKVFGQSAAHLRTPEKAKNEPSWWEKIKAFLWKKTEYEEKFPYTPTPK